jgi:hypothetical protein
VLFRDDIERIAETATGLPDAVTSLRVEPPRLEVAASVGRRGLHLAVKAADARPFSRA